MFIKRAFFILTCGVCLHCSATTLSFESGFGNGQKSFSEGPAAFSLTGALRIAQSNVHFGSGGGSWSINTGLNIPVTGSAGSIQLSNPESYAFNLQGFDLWTSASAGNGYAPGSITVIGRLWGGGTVQSNIWVAPTGNAPYGWDTSNDVFSFLGKNLTSLEFIINAGINYLAIDNITLQAGSIPEPAAWSVLVGGFSLGFVLLRRRRSNHSKL